MLVARNEAEKALNLVNAFVDNADAQPGDPIERTRLAAEAIEQLSRQLTKPGQEAMAQQFFRRAEALYQRDSDRYPERRWLMAAYYARQEKADQAVYAVEQLEGNDLQSALAVVCPLVASNNKTDARQLERLDRIMQSALTARIGRRPCCCPWPTCVPSGA